ncbi:Cyclic AMP-dependent transcription factor ATF-6 alpha [Halotydeus destructor]|nr:Cyclic AMP-dependent transcription factor ATF-6 alpha [Halotydeus destructor]
MEDVLSRELELLADSERFDLVNILSAELVDTNQFGNVDAIWTSNVSGAGDLTCNALINELIGADGESPSLNITPPDTPPDSDRSSPPSCSEFSYGQSYSPGSVYSDGASVYSDKTVYDQVNTKFCNQPQNVQFVSLNHPVVYQPVSHHSPLVLNSAMQTLPSVNITKTTTAPFPQKATKSRKQSSDSDKLALSNALKEARKIRNREAARNSFHKQKEHVTALESKCATLERENVELKRENQSLKSKLSFLEKETNTLRETFQNSLSNVGGKRKALSLLAVVFMIGLNIGPYSGLISGGSKSHLHTSQESNVNFADIHSGRTLLWADDKIDRKLDAEVKDVKPSHYNSTVPANCQQYVNQSETRRLENDLRVWVQRIEREIKMNSKTRQKAAKATVEKADASPMSRMKSWLSYGEQGVKDIELFKVQSGEMPFSYESLLGAIKRRDDTFYFVSLSAGDHLLLPAETNRTRVRPRFSIIMPSMSTLNETSLDTGVNLTYSIFTMMQIDCEVMNTKVIQISNLVNEPKVSATKKGPLKRNRATNRRVPRRPNQNATST